MKTGNFDFPDLATVPEDVELVAVGQTDITGEPIYLTPGGNWPKLIADGSTWNSEVLIWAYKNGYFPMPLDAKESPLVISWWSPNPRGVLDPAKIKISNSLKKSIKKFSFTVNQDFEFVIRNCGSPTRPSGWITEHVIVAYLELHSLGFAHSIEVRNLSGQIVGGLYGVEVGGLFAGESMFHNVTDASKAALVFLAQQLNDGGGRLIDCQWQTDHLATLGVREISRTSYVAQLTKLLQIEPRFSRYSQS